MKSFTTQAASRCTDQRVIGLINDYKHLPKWFRDFHNQKDVFKAIDDTWDRPPPDGINWVMAHCYVIDRFLRFMAFHGYTLRKTKRFGDLDIQETTELCRKARFGIPANTSGEG